MSATEIVDLILQHTVSLYTQENQLFQHNISDCSYETL